MVKTTDVLANAGGRRKLAELLGVTTQALYLWGDDVPELRVYQLRVLRPEWFNAKGELVKPRKKGASK